MCTGNSGIAAGEGETLLGGLLTATGYGSSVGVPLILGGLGSAASGAATQEQLNKQNDIAAAGIIKQGELQKQGENDVGQTINTVANSNATAQAKTASQLAAYRNALLQAQPQSSAASPSVPGASKAFKSAQTAASGSAQDYVNAIAGSAATTQGTQLERVGENQQMADTASKLGVLSNQSNEQNYLTQLKIRATNANPWLKGLGMLLQGAGVAAGVAGGASAADAALSGSGTVTDTLPTGLSDIGSVSGEGGMAISAPAFTSSALSVANPAAGGGGLFSGIGSYLNALGARRQQPAPAGP